MMCDDVATITVPKLLFRSLLIKCVRMRVSWHHVQCVCVCVCVCVVFVCVRVCVHGVVTCVCMCVSMCVCCDNDLLSLHLRTPDIFAS